MNVSLPLVTPAEVKQNAKHLEKVSDDVVSVIVSYMHVIFIQDALSIYADDATKVSKLKVIEKYLSQHTATLDVRRADSEGVAGMSKAISVPKEQGLGLTEYGQMAKKIAKSIPLSWAIDDLPASLVIY